MWASLQSGTRTSGRTVESAADTAPSTAAAAASPPPSLTPEARGPSARVFPPTPPVNRHRRSSVCRSSDRTSTTRSAVSTPDPSPGVASDAGRARPVATDASSGPNGNVATGSDRHAATASAALGPATVASRKERWSNQARRTGRAAAVVVTPAAAVAHRTAAVAAGENEATPPQETLGLLPPPLLLLLLPFPPPPGLPLAGPPACPPPPIHDANVGPNAGLRPSHAPPPSPPTGVNHHPI